MHSIQRSSLPSSLPRALFLTFTCTRTHMHMQQRSRGARVMYSCTHTSLLRVCTVYRSPRVHTKATVSAIRLLYFLPPSSLFLSLSPCICILHLFLPRSWLISQSEKRRLLCCFREKRHRDYSKQHCDGIYIYH